MMKRIVTKEQVKFKLRNYDTVVYDEEETQEVRYLYTIEDSGGFLEMNLTIPADADPVEYFCIKIKLKQLILLLIINTIYDKN